MEGFRIGDPDDFVTIAPRKVHVVDVGATTRRYRRESAEGRGVHQPARHPLEGCGRKPARPPLDRHLGAMRLSPIKISRPIASLPAALSLDIPRWVMSHSTVLPQPYFSYSRLSWNKAAEPHSSRVRASIF